MGLDFAIDALYETGWNAEDSQGCRSHVDGRRYPTEDLVRRSFEENGFRLTIRHVQLFDCYRAEWREAQAGGQDGGGSVVGKTAEEAAVYAMSQLRRQLLAGAKA